MLVLSRKVGEKLLVGDDIVLTVNRISGNRVAIGIEAPREVRIVRGELHGEQESDKGRSEKVAPKGGVPNTASMGEPTIAVASKADA